MRAATPPVLAIAICLFLFIASAVAAQDSPNAPAEEGRQPRQEDSLRHVDEADDIQPAIDALPRKGGTVFIKAGTYLLKKGIHLNRSNLTLSGEQGTILKLADQVRQPVILIGSDKPYPDQADRIRNIRITTLEIDGNMANQQGAMPEFDPTRCVDPAKPSAHTCWIRNNGIDVRMVEDLWLDSLNIHHARSGGVVVSWKSKRVFINRSSFHHNFFDGIALYDSEDINVTDFFSHENSNAGLSLDNRLRLCSFTNGSLRGNEEAGIFVRDSHDLLFSGLMVQGNGGHGGFVSHREKEGEPGVIEKNTGVRRLFFSGCAFLDNNGFGLWLASPASESTDTTVIGCFFSGNRACPMGHTGASLNAAANIFQ